MIDMNTVSSKEVSEALRDNPNLVYYIHDSWTIYRPYILRMDAKQANSTDPLWVYVFYKNQWRK